MSNINEEGSAYLQEGKESDCSGHKKDLFGQTDMKVVAEAIGDLNYETLAEMLKELAMKLSRDCDKDYKNDRVNIGEKLLHASNTMKLSAKFINDAWLISKPFMNKPTEP